MSEELAAYCLELAAHARSAAGILARAKGAAKNAWLTRSADALERRTNEILHANNNDVEAAAASGVNKAQLDRLRLTPDRVHASAEGLRQIATLPDPIGRVLEGGKRPNGLRVLKV